MRKVKYTKFWGIEFRDEYNTDFCRGCWALLLIFSFPTWIGFYILYRLTREFGRVITRVSKTKKGEKEVKEDYY